MKVHGIRLAAAAGVAMAALTSCTLSEKDLKPTITKDQAAQQLKSYDTEIRAALLGRPQATTQEPLSVGCETADITGPKGRVELSTHAVVAADHPEQNPAVLEAFEAKVKSLGFVRYSDSEDFHVYENKANGFSASLKESFDDSKTLTLSVASPCVWPNGTSGPEG